eukprot:TRINITY_DN15584_c0_g1_i1.p1 TRINITY_DN15584_c0_g1~~TRINITY_DN15584_c0_g1_i1.p1  ORF type:complete len:642 (+),score=74.35 TRINITY_DN15584_c0_g1_i1:262-1926(+)
MRLKVWVRTTWTDERLSWDPGAYGNVSQVHVLAGDVTRPEDTEIWLPDLQLYNANVGTTLTLEPAIAVVSSSGYVYWSRPGVLDTMCKFSGLVAFPLDRLSCDMEWGGWLFSGGFQGISLAPGPTPGYSFSQSEDTSGSSYQQHSIEEVHVSIKENVYDCCASEPWQVVKYTIFMKRSTFYYALLIIIPNIIMTYLSFGVFWMPAEVGERLSYGVTLVLVVEVGKVTVSSFIPVCGELLWVDLFLLECTLFTLASLLESMTVLFFNYHSGRRILPSWLLWLKPWQFQNLFPDSLDPDSESCTGDMFHKLNIVSAEPEIKEEEMNLMDVNKKLVFFESLFFRIDENSEATVGFEHMRSFLSFVRPRLDFDARTRLLERVLVQQESKELDKFDRVTFLAVCTEALWYQPLDVMQLGAENYFSSKHRQEKRHHLKWQEVSLLIDGNCRFWFPFLFTATMVFMANVEFSDHYRMPDTVMFEGPGDVSLSVLGTINTLIMPLIGGLCLLATLKVRSLKKQHDVKAAMAAKSIRRQIVSEHSFSDRGTVERTEETVEVHC